MSALYRDDTGALTVRLVNLTPEAATVTVSRDGTPASGAVVDLTGSAQRGFRGTLALRPWELLTVRLDEP